MITGNPFRWTDPKTWPWFFYLWIAVIAAGWLKPAWIWYWRQRVSTWPVVAGQIEYASVGETKQRFFSMSSRGKPPNYVGELGYSYFAEGAKYTGVYKREFWSEEEALEFVRELRGRAVSVQQKPGKASVSALSEASVETLLNTRPVRPQADVELFKFGLRNSIPEWWKPFLWICVGLSGVGLVLSLWVHLGSLMGRRVAPAPLFWILHIGIFVVWIPAGLAAYRLVGDMNQKDFWKRILKGSPEWMLYMVYGFGGYALINFAVFWVEGINKGGGGSGGANPAAAVWRGFSGHWMAFYAAALAILYSAVNSGGTVRQCVNGHSLPPGADFCSRCGQAVARRR